MAYHDIRYAKNLSAQVLRHHSRGRLWGARDGLSSTLRRDGGN